MRRIILAVSAVLVLGLSACGGGGYDTKTVRATEKDTNEFGFSDTPPKTKVGKQGPQKVSPGDTLTFRSLLMQGAKQAGQLDATCTITHAGTFETSRAQCQGTATLPGGQLAVTVGGPFGSAATHGAIVGGTGKYSGAGGTFNSTNGSSGPSKDTFEIQIPKK